jgi:hypothetical protein
MNINEPIKCNEVATPEFEIIINELNNELCRIRNISNSFHDKLNKLKSKELTKGVEPLLEKEPQGIVDNLFSIIKGFRDANNNLYGSLENFENLVG